MNVSTRKVLDKSFTSLAYASLGAMFVAVCLFLIPIIYNGLGAVIFTGTVEHEKFLQEILNEDLSSGQLARIEESKKARQPLYDMMQAYQKPANSDKVQETLNNALESSAKQLESHSDEIFEALSLAGSKRADAIKEISHRFLASYVAEIDKAFDESAKLGTSLVLVDILENQKNQIADIARREIEILEKKQKLSIIQKSSLRRNIGVVAYNEIDVILDKLHTRNESYNTFKAGVAELLGPATQARKEEVNLMRQKFGQTRLDNAKMILEDDVLKINVIAKDDNGIDYNQRVISAQYFAGTPVEKMVSYVEDNFDAMLKPHLTLYLGFFFDSPYDSNIFGGIWPMILGTFYLTFGAMIIAAPLGIIAAIYFSEYAKGGKIINILRMCVGTLAGVPSIVFGLFGLAFIINTLKVSESKSVLAGSITLSLLILPTIIRSCEEALKAVPHSYREASLGLGAGKWRSIMTVILPAALPSMLTGIIISMGRAAGETAPIIFTAATSTGAALAINEVFTQATPALPWNIYNICSEHEMAERVTHVQYGMVLTLITIVLILNAAAICLRARLQKKMKA